MSLFRLKYWCISFQMIWFGNEILAENQSLICVVQLFEINEWSWLKSKTMSTMMLFTDWNLHKTNPFRAENIFYLRILNNLFPYLLNVVSSLIFHYEIMSKWAWLKQKQQYSMKYETSGDWSLVWNGTCKKYYYYS